MRLDNVSRTRLDMSNGPLDGQDSTSPVQCPVSCPTDRGFCPNQPIRSEWRDDLPAERDPALSLVTPLDLEARGLTVSREGDDLLISPPGRLTDDDRSALRRWKSHLLALVSYQPEAVQ